MYHFDASVLRPQVCDRAGPGDPSEVWRIARAVAATRLQSTLATSLNQGESADRLEGLFERLKGLHSGEGAETATSIPLNPKSSLKQPILNSEMALRQVDLRGCVAALVAHGGLGKRSLPWWRRWR